MKKSVSLKTGDSIENAIIIDAQNSIEGVIEEYQHIDRICSSQDENFISVEQTLIKENR